MVTWGMRVVLTNTHTHTHTLTPAGRPIVIPAMYVPALRNCLHCLFAKPAMFAILYTQTARNLKMSF